VGAASSPDGEVNCHLTSRLVELTTRGGVKGGCPAWAWRWGPAGGPGFWRGGLGLRLGSCQGAGRGPGSPGLPCRAGGLRAGPRLPGAVARFLACI